MINYIAQSQETFAQRGNINAIAYLIVTQSLERKENKGAFYSLDNY